jgi:hypothetical protein
MKTSLSAAIGGIALVGGLSVGAANANIIMFDVSGTLLANPPTTTTNTTLSGTLEIDVSTGTLTGVDLMVPGFSDFTHLDSSAASGLNDWYITTDNGTGCGPAVDCLDRHAVLRVQSDTPAQMPLRTTAGLAQLRKG